MSVDCDTTCTLNPQSSLVGKKVAFIRSRGKYGSLLPLNTDFALRESVTVELRLASCDGLVETRRVFLDEARPLGDCEIWNTLVV
jgi:hypothetical protein